MSLFSTTLNSPIGNIEITGDESSIYSVLFKDTPDYPEAPTNPVLDDCKKQLREYFDGKIRKFYLPLKQEGTVFQQDVWTELCNIPFGRTVAYIDIARKISNEKSVRAVGMTNGRNQIAIIVPCHRVISNKGDLTGYAGGIWRKKWLLEHEAKVAHGVQKLELV